MEKQSVSVRITDFFMKSVTVYGNGFSNTNKKDMELSFDESF